jgi:hypothetical protein
MKRKITWNRVKSERIKINDEMLKKIVLSKESSLLERNIRNDK